MGLPDIVIEFSKKAVTAIQNGSTGIVGIMLKDAKNKGAMVLRSVDEIPTEIVLLVQRIPLILRERLLALHLR